MGFEELLKKEYLARCANLCNHGGYSRLESEREQIRKEIIDKYGTNGNRDEVSRKVLVCERIVFDFLEELTQQKFKHYMWIPDFYEKKLEDKVSSALQSA